MVRIVLRENGLERLASARASPCADDAHTDAVTVSAPGKSNRISASFQREGCAADPRRAHRVTKRRSGYGAWSQPGQAQTFDAARAVDAIDPDIAQSCPAEPGPRQRSTQLLQRGVERPRHVLTVHVIITDHLHVRKCGPGPH